MDSKWETTLNEIPNADKTKDNFKSISQSLALLIDESISQC